MIDRQDRDWYRNAVIYQLHVKVFADSNNDGVGDFAGLTQKLDYLASLGVTVLWLMPFYPSPLRDDGYDIADYRAIHPSYGTMEDFQGFVDAAHDRGMRVISELVINHTSDQHPWFQRARRAPIGSPERDYYVWSDDDKQYSETRIIFCDTEPSNWSWDAQAGQYYWHRFYHHQPDLNFDNPTVRQEVRDILHFWLDKGVDGLRLDAVPYLVEREGTSNENLQETHAVLKEIRAEVDKHYPDRILLAEANMWPEDVLPYFGDGDECHMAFHFPLMPRMYMAIAREDRNPITDIMAQTPPIPDGCQWAIFLRNHDELTLEMVTEDERDFMWRFYASDRQARINLGIRRRLAPLMENDRRRIELMKAMLLSMPGTPVVYYGDELGMGDNIYLGDRDGVRTPMQWSPDRNGGFSRSDPARLYLPAIQDPIYGFEALNVEAQTRLTSSLLNWTRRMVQVRQARTVFGTGAQRFLYPGNRKILAYLRELDGEVVACIFNLSRSAQAVELDLSRFKGCVPIELLGRSPFPPIGDLPYLLTLPAYGFYWFAIVDEAQAPEWHEEIPEPLPELVTLVSRDGLVSLTVGRPRERLEHEALPAFVQNQRWFAAKDTPSDRLELGVSVELSLENSAYLLIMAESEAHPEDAQDSLTYFLPLAVEWSEQAGGQGWPLLPFTIAKVRKGASMGALYDAMAAGDFALGVMRAIARGDKITLANGGRVEFEVFHWLAEREIEADCETRRLGIDQSNNSMVIGDQRLLKVFRRLNFGPHPEVELSLALNRAGFNNTPALLGAMTYCDDHRSVVLAVAFQMVGNEGDGWAFTLDYLLSAFTEYEACLTHTNGSNPVPATPDAIHAAYLDLIEVLGQRIAEMHRAFASLSDDPIFAPIPVEASLTSRWRDAVREEAQRAHGALRNGLDRNTAGRDSPLVQELLDRWHECLNLIETVPIPEEGLSVSRIHGDLHLGQVLIAGTDWYVIDFEGEPSKPLEQRRAKQSALRDVAGMVRSFDYAAASMLVRIEQSGEHDHGIGRRFVADWLERVQARFLDAYRRSAEGAAIVPRDPAAFDALVDLFVLEKALYEIDYEAGNRPSWIGIPVRGVLSILNANRGFGQ